jgi:hypothetical protein
MELPQFSAGLALTTSPTSLKFTSTPFSFSQTRSKSQPQSSCLTPYFLTITEDQKVSDGFSPNFCLAKLRDCIATNPKFCAGLKALKGLVSGGESIEVSTCAALTAQLKRFDEDIRAGLE